MRNVLSMLFLGFVVAVLAAVMMTFATRQLSRVNEGHYLPVVIGRFAVRSPSTSTALRVGAQTATLIATLIVLNATWDYTAPWPSLILAATTLVAPVAIPVMAITWRTIDACLPLVGDHPGHQPHSRSRVSQDFVSRSICRSCVDTTTAASVASSAWVNSSTNAMDR